MFYSKLPSTNAMFFIVQYQNGVLRDGRDLLDALMIFIFPIVHTLGNIDIKDIK